MTDSVVDVTDAMNQFRECARHVWNVHMLPIADRRRDWGLRDDFRQSAIAMFKAIVLRPLGGEWAELIDVSFDSPIAGMSLVVNGRSDVMINRDISSGYWDFPVKSVNAGEAHFSLAGFYDWHELSFCEFGLYLAQIDRFDGRPEVVGRQALLPVGASVRAVFDPSLVAVR